MTGTDLVEAFWLLWFWLGQFWLTISKQFVSKIIPKTFSKLWFIMALLKLSLVLTLPDVSIEPVYPPSTFNFPRRNCEKCTEILLSGIFSTCTLKCEHEPSRGVWGHASKRIDSRCAILVYFKISTILHILKDTNTMHRAVSLTSAYEDGIRTYRHCIIFPVFKPKKNRYCPSPFFY